VQVLDSPQDIEIVEELVMQLGEIVARQVQDLEAVHQAVKGHRRNVGQAAVPHVNLPYSSGFEGIFLEIVDNKNNKILLILLGIVQPLNMYKQPKILRGTKLDLLRIRTPTLRV